MAKLKTLLILFLTLAVTAANSQKQQLPTTVEDRDPSGLLREIIAARGIDHWTPNEVLMGPTRPPMQPVRAIPEWEKARAVLFALDSEMINSFELNRRVRTTNTPADVYEKKSAVAEVLNELICHSDETGDEDTSESHEAAHTLTEERCEKGALDSITQERYFDELALAHDFVATVTQLSRFVDVVLLVNSAHSGDLAVRRVIDNLKTFDAAQQLLATPHVIFAQASFDTKWIRDYGPLFVRDSEGVITSVDARYDPQSTNGSDEVKRLTDLTRQLLQRSANDEASARLDSSAKEDEGSSSRLKDDQIPTMLAPRFRQRDGNLLRRYPVPVVRPPIALAGGDFLSDGMGTGFTSVRTLRDNGGNIEALDLNFKKYMGIETIVYLHPLPGETVKHIDMFLQIAGPNVLLLGKFLCPPTSDGGEARLQSAACGAMEDNLAIIRDHYERLGRRVNVIDDDVVTLDSHAINIVRVPMPAVRRPFADMFEALSRDIDSALRDYDEHSILVRLLARFQNRLEDLQERSKSLAELEKETAERHPVDEHDIELLDALNSTANDLRKIVIRYSRLSGEYWSESDHLAEVADRLASSLQRLRGALGKSIGDKQTLSPQAVQVVSAESTDLIHMSAEFVDRTQGDRIKDVSLVKASQSRLVNMIVQMQQMQTQYQYGTDLYRTYMNFLPVHTRTLFVLVIPNYRDQTLRGDGEKAIKRIRAVYAQLYGDVELVTAPSDAFIKELGSVHCLTKVLPEQVDFLTSQRNRATSGALR